MVQETSREVEESPRERGCVGKEISTWALFCGYQQRIYREYHLFTEK